MNFHTIPIMIGNPNSMKEDFGGAFSPKTDADSYSTEGGLEAKRNPKDLSEIGGFSHDRYKTQAVINLFIFQLILTLWSESARCETTNSPQLKGQLMTIEYKNKDDAFWKKYLSPAVYDICRLNGTEKARTGKFDKFYEKGIYYCACCGGDHPVYSSEAKFDSKTGWPSFYEPLPGGIVERQDPHDNVRGFFGYARTEVICARCDGHLGHVFDDGPQPTGKRYCMNSLALTFSPVGETPKRTFDVSE